MIQERLGELRADEGKQLHKIGTDVYRKRVLITAAVTPEDWEEVDVVPPYTQGEYEAKVAQLVRQRYTADEEFALQRKAISMQAHGQSDEAVSAEFNAYCDYVEECKAEAREALISGGVPSLCSGHDGLPGAEAWGEDENFDLPPSSLPLIHSSTLTDGGDE